MIAEPNPARHGRNETRHAAARRPSCSIPSSSSIASIVACWRATRKCGSSGIESSDTKPYTTRRTLPAAHSIPTSGPPYATTVRSRRSERRIARTIDIGLRRDPQPPMPIVMPSRSSATTSSSVQRLSVMRRAP